MQHEMVERGIGKAEENFIANGIFQRVVFKKVRCEPVCVVPAYRTEYHVGFTVAERFKQILRTLFGMLVKVIHTSKRVRHEFYSYSHVPQSFQSDITLELNKIFAEYSA